MESILKTLPMLILLNGIRLSIIIFMEPILALRIMYNFQKRILLVKTGLTTQVV